MWRAVESSGGGGGGGTGSESPSARGKHSATLVRGYVYVLGGRGAGGTLPLRDFWRYSLALGRWERLERRGEPPPALQEHAAVAHRGRLYVFGGEAALSTETPLWTYDTETQIWRKLPGPGSGPPRRRGARVSHAAGPCGRRGHSAHALHDCLLVFGGYQDLRGSTNELWAFHYECETWHQVRTATAGPARHRHAGALYDDRLYVHGGQCDLRDCADLWYYDTMSRVWSPVRTPARVSPSARAGHSGLRAGPHLYIFGGEVNGHATNELWRFHFATETWERMATSLQWPSARVDSVALVVPAFCAPRAPLAPASAPPVAAPPPRTEPPAGLLREISKLSSFTIRRNARCSYTVLAPDQDSTESLAPALACPPSLAKSRSAFLIDERLPADGDEGPRHADVAETFRRDLSRDPISVPNFADMTLPTPVLSPVEATKLVYLDSEEEEEMKREREDRRNGTGVELIDVGPAGGGAVVILPKSASVRFRTDEETDLSTSDYASAHRLSGTSSMGFCNPHYLGPDVRRLGATLTPDSGVAPGDIELQDLGSLRLRDSVPPAPAPAACLLLVGGREPAHPALLHSPLSMWTYRLL